MLDFISLQWSRIKRPLGFITCTALAAGLCFVACESVEHQACENDAIDCADPVRSLPAIKDALITFTGSCAYATNTMTVTVKSGDIVIISTNGNNLTVNGTQCGNANVTNTKSIQISEDTSSVGAESVVIDYLKGFFALGSQTSGSGITTNYGTDPNDKFQIRMPNQNANAVLGLSGINVNGDTSKDVTFGQVPTQVFISFGYGNDTFSAFGDTVTGATFTGPVSAYGGEGNDTLRGGNGNDHIIGEGGDDFLNGEPTAAGGDYFDGGNGNDTLSYAQRANNVFISVGDPNAECGETGEGDTITDTIENVYGGNGNDTLTGSPNTALKKFLFGGPGNDNFVQQTAGGADSSDYMSGGPGTDTVDYTIRTVNLAVTLDGTANDGYTGENDNVNSDIENIFTGSGTDTITGNSNNNVFFAGGGTNTINGMDGDDTFLQGSDANNTGMDTMDGGNGTDTVDYSNRTNALVLVVDGATPSGDTGNSESDTIRMNIENVYGGAGNDNIVGNPNNNYLVGNAGNDNIIAGAGDDTIDAGAGSDYVDCGSGNDIAINGESDDPNCELQVP